MENSDRICMQMDIYKRIYDTAYVNMCPFENKQKKNQ